MQSFTFRSNRHSGIIIDAECWGRTQVNVFTVNHPPNVSDFQAFLFSTKFFSVKGGSLIMNDE